MKLYNEIKDVKDKIFNHNKEFMIKEVYSKYSTSDFLEILEMIERDL